MELPNTTENRVLASTVNARIRSDARLLNARAALYRFAGLGLLCGLLRCGHRVRRARVHALRLDQGVIGVLLLCFTSD